MTASAFASVSLAALALAMLATSTVTRPVRMAESVAVASVQKDDRP